VPAIGMILVHSKAGRSQLTLLHGTTKQKLTRKCVAKPSV